MQKKRRENRQSENYIDKCSDIQREREEDERERERQTKKNGGQTKTYIKEGIKQKKRKRQIETE